MRVAALASLLHQRQKQKVQDGVMKISEEKTGCGQTARNVVKTRQLTKRVYLFLQKWLFFRQERQTDGETVRQEVMYFTLKRMSESSS